MAVEVAATRRRFTRSEYHRMAEVGILGEDDRVELIQGEIVEMSPSGRRHKAFVANLAQLLIVRLAGRAAVRLQSGGAQLFFDPGLERRAVGGAVVAVVEAHRPGAVVAEQPTAEPQQLIEIEHGRDFASEFEESGQQFCVGGRPDGSSGPRHVRVAHEMTGLY